ncbi:ABC transporter ATP-binding protein [Niveibacterium terrae]|uniref:ABC transporter ATP-binding protein n=1 Tax=Niveibacterium terrae TaxID=3373598 RepID=UPI003A931642
MRPSVVHLNGISKSYRMGEVGVRALSDASLSVSPGEMLALTGPSGSGKSTLLNIAGLIDCADSGRYLLEGREVGALDEHERALLRRVAIGFIFQGFNLVPVMSVADNVDYPLFLSGVPTAERRKRVGEMLAKVGLSEQAARRPDALSGGQRQRVAVARALIKTPRLVIADEPTANLDSQTANQVISLIRELCHEEGAACLVATHDSRMSDRCDRVLAMRDGCLLETVPPAQTLQGEAHEVA